MIRIGLACRDSRTGSAVDRTEDVCVPSDGVPLFLPSCFLLRGKPLKPQHLISPALAHSSSLKMQEANQQLIPNVKACRDGPSLSQGAQLREAMVKPERQGDPPGIGEGGSHVKQL